MAEAYITHTGSFLPNEAVDNDSMESILGQIGERPSRARRVVLRNNGIRSRYYAIDAVSGEPTHSNTELAAEAIRQMVDDRFCLSSIDCLACGTSIADQIVPGHGVMVHGELQCPPCEVVSLGGVCVSGMAALKYAYLAVRADEAQTAVASGSERPSAVLHARRFQQIDEFDEQTLEREPELIFGKDFLRWMLSDGAGAVAIRPAPAKSGLSLRVDWISETSYANEADVCMYAGGEKRIDGGLTSWLDRDPQYCMQNSLLTLTQDVKQLNSNIVPMTLERPLAALMDNKGLQAEEVDYFLPHYSSKFFREPVHSSLQSLGFDIPFEKWFTNLESKGNTGAASIFIMLDELFRSERLQEGEKILCFVPESGRFSSAFMHLTVCSG